MRLRWLIALLFLFPLPALAGFRPVGRAVPERFDAARKTWSPLPVLIEFDNDSSQPRLRLSGAPLGQALTARLDFKHLPHYGEWLAQRQAQGGAPWSALKAVLDGLGDGPAVALTHEKLRASEPLELLLGLRRGSQFELYATLRGRLEPCGKDLCFEPGEPVFADESTALAWQLLKPLALAQAKNAAKR